MGLGRADPWLPSLPLKGQTSQPVCSTLVLLGHHFCPGGRQRPGQVCGQQFSETLVLGSGCRNLIPAGQLMCLFPSQVGKKISSLAPLSFSLALPGAGD